MHTVIAAVQQAGRALLLSAGREPVGLEVRTRLESVGFPPLLTALVLVIAQTASRWSNVPLGSSEPMKYSADEFPGGQPGWGANGMVPPTLRCGKRAKCTVGFSATRSFLENA